MSHPDNIVGKIYHRPWGTYQTLALEKGFQVKILTVNPNGQLSLQKHLKRNEHWVVVAGTATVTIGDKKKQCKANQAAYVPIETAHRIENFTDKPVIVVEVQVGDYLGEDDIIRLRDVYGR